MLLVPKNKGKWHNMITLILLSIPVLKKTRGLWHVWGKTEFHNEFQAMIRHDDKAVGLRRKQKEN